MSTYTVIPTEEFLRWKNSFGPRHREVTRRIAARQLAMTEGHFGHTRSVGKGVTETKIDFGPVYRLYYTIRQNVVIVLLIGGDKTTQQQDILRAQDLAANLPEDLLPTQE